MAEEVVEELIDEFELAKYRRMANDAISGHFPQHIYGDQSHIEVLAKALEHCVEVLEDENGASIKEQLDNALGKVEDLEARLDESDGKLQRISEISCIHKTEVATK